MGFANSILGPTNPFAQYVDQNQDKLHGFFAGLASGGLPGAAKGALDGGVTDKANNEAKSQKNATIAFFKSKGYADLVQRAEAGEPVATLYGEAIKRSTPKDPIKMSSGDYLANPTTGAPLSQPVGGTAPYDGTSMDAQNWNILLTGDPSTPEYAAAWSQINEPKITYSQGPNGVVPVMQQPNIPSSIRPPTGMGAPSPQGQGGPGVSAGAPVPGTTPKPNEQQVRAQMMFKVIAPEAQGLVGDGSAQKPGTFEALANGWDIGKDQTGTAGRMMPFGVGTPSENYLKAKGSVRTIIASYLYVASGATANPGEVENQASILTPQLNDPPSVVADKKRRLQVMVDAVKQAADGKPVDLNAIMSGGASASGSTGDPDLDRALQQYGQ